jgi:hypothetical protein
MYALVHARLGYHATTYQPQDTNDAALVSSILLVAASFDASPPTSQQGVIDKLNGILGADSHAMKAVRRAMSQLK